MIRSTRRSYQIAAKYPSTPALLVDSGNFSDIPTPQGKARTQALLDGMETLGYQAVNVGERDVRQGYDALMATLDGRDVPLLSANLVDKETQKPVFPPYAIVEAPAFDGSGTTKVGVIGVLRYNPIFRKAGRDGGQLAILHPVNEYCSGTENPTKNKSNHQT